MLGRGAIQFYINGPPPIAKATGPPYLVNLINSQDSPDNNTSSEQSLKSDGLKQDLDSLVNKTHNPLLTLRSMRILDLFPDKLIIDENKVSFIYKSAFGVKSIHSVLIENITYVEAHTSLFTGCLVVTDSSNYRHPIELKIENLRKDAAIRARKLIQGLVHAKTLKIGFSQLSPYDVENNLEELGRVTGED
ncbi:hypothetical protein HYW44_01800 [Candidatus Daviesbacteria bacterium]|nr:hypothetical protein [Candidatus Daviesbacteria bacterium]